jgi:hypothetical protein
MEVMAVVGAVWFINNSELGDQLMHFFDSWHH